MDENKIIKLKIKKLLSCDNNFNVVKNDLQTNPILQKMLNCNSLTQKMKFKFKDLFR